MLIVEIKISVTHRGYQKTHMYDITLGNEAEKLLIVKV